MKFYRTLQESYKQAKQMSLNEIVKDRQLKKENSFVNIHLITCLKSLQHRGTESQVSQ